MSWFFIALGAHVLWSAVNLADQYLVAKFKENNAPQVTLIMFAAPIALITGAIISWIFRVDIALFSTSSIILLLISGVIQVVGIWWYLQALLHSEASGVALWFLLMPIFGYIFGYFILGEALTLLQLLGIGIILVGALVFSIRYHSESKQHSVPYKMIAYMVAAAILLVFADVLFKKAAPLEQMFWPALGIDQLGTAIVGFALLFIPGLRKDFFRMCFGQGKKVFSVNIISEVVTMTGNALKYLAILIAPVALVASLEGYQPLIVYLMSIPLSFLVPTHYTFERSAWHIVLKIIGAVFLIIGTYLLL